MVSSLRQVYSASFLDSNADGWGEYVLSPSTFPVRTIGSFAGLWEQSFSLGNLPPGIATIATAMEANTDCLDHNVVSAAST